MAGDGSSVSGEELARMRREYAAAALDESSVAGNPIEQFRRWFDDVVTAGIPEANAMAVATTDGRGRPSARIMLLKGFDARGFVFFTNYLSRKGEELLANPRAALLFFWEPLERQVRIEGQVERVSAAESDAYFHVRPVGAQIGALASDQSRVIPSREFLEEKERALAETFKGRDIPRPAHWGGYRVLPDWMEFWQGRPSRLHDRLGYTLRGGVWTIERLSP